MMHCIIVILWICLVINGMVNKKINYSERVKPLCSNYDTTNLSYEQ